jgi:hypothetical protein
MAEKYPFQTEVKASTPFEFNIKKQALVNLSRLDVDSLDYINNLAKLDADTLGKLSELSQNPKAIKKLKDNWNKLKALVML